MSLTAIAFLIALHISGLGGIPSKYFWDGSTSNSYFPSDTNEIKNKHSGNGLSVYRNKRDLDEYEFQCADKKQIIDELYLCDGIKHCNDSSDETAELCSGIQCFQSKCSYGACILDNKICNNVTDCVDGSDEENCLCKPYEFECKDKLTCIDSMNTCNGKYDCPDKSDENYEMCNSVPCPRSFRCNSGGCIPKVNYCNKVHDCDDGSDELYNETTCPFGELPDACTVPEKPDYGHFIHYTTKQKVSYGDTVNKHGYIELKCSKNSDCQGPTLSKCSENSTWDYMPSCKKRCRFTPSKTVVAECMDQTKRSFPCENSKYLKHDTIVVYKCRSKHFFELNQNSKTTTCNNGIWDNSRVVCKEDCGLESGYSQSNITKKQQAEAGTFPWHVAIYQFDDEYFDYSSYTCGGSIVKSNIIISAAHCFWDYSNSKPYPENNYQVVAGKRFRERNSDIDIQEAWIAKISIPPQYNGLTNFESYDIAIVQLVTQLTFTQFVSPICLDYNEEFNKKQLETLNKGKVAGWGKIENGTFADSLLYSFLPVIDYGTCEPALEDASKKFLTTDKFCAGYENSVYLCQGDSGGGLVFNSTANYVTRWYIRGIVSNTSPDSSNSAAICKKSYALFTNILTHKDFIIDNLGN